MLANLKAAIAKAKAIAAGADMQALYGKLGGKSWLIVVFFAVTGFLLERAGKLTSSYAELATALSAFHIGRAIMQDRAERRDDDGKG